MNTERMLKLAEILEHEEDHFSITEVFQEHGQPALYGPGGNRAVLRYAAVSDLSKCGTTACIAGWALHLWPFEIDYDLDWGTNAADILGITPDTANDLFYRFDLDAQGAAGELRRMVKVDSYDRP